MDEKFLSRGKNKFTKAWVEGYYCPMPENIVEILENGFIAPRLNYKPCIIQFTQISEQWICIEIDYETLGRYTGLRDKNKVRIFEGDIVKFFGMQGQIVFEKGTFGIAILPNIDWTLLDINVPSNNRPCFCYNDNFISLWEIYWNFEQDDNPLYEVEVIGNAYDNLELLKEV